MDAQSGTQNTASWTRKAVRRTRHRGRAIKGGPATRAGHPFALPATIDHGTRGRRSSVGKEAPIFHLIQALQETQELAADHDDDPEWQMVHDQAESVIDLLTEDGADPSATSSDAHRIDRSVELDEQQAELAAAAMTALHDRPEPEQLELARAAIQQLTDAIG